MKKRNVKCFKGYAQVGMKFNIEVYYTVPDYYYTRLYTCMACGTVLCADQEDIDCAGKDFNSVLAAKKCPECGELLSSTLKPYPQFFRMEDGSNGHFEVPRLIPADSESLSVEFWDLYS